MIAIDIGNTKTALGFFRDGILTHKWKVATDKRQTKDQYHLLVEQFLASFGERFATAGSMILASVVPSVTRSWNTLRKEIDLYWVTHDSPISYSISIPEPQTLGPDRIADAEAAVRKFGAPVIVIDAGTALTVSAVNADRRFIGGTIAPGVGISVKSLFANAARIQEFDLGLPSNVIGSTTRAAVESGIHFGYAAMINGLVEKFEHESGMKNPKVVATGGSASWLAPSLRTGIQVEPNLTLEGLHYLHGNLRKAKHA
jgi:type III pantothenate kinase